MCAEVMSKKMNNMKCPMTTVTITPLSSQSRTHFAIVTLNGKKYSIGGWNGFVSLKSAEVHEPSTNMWKFISPMNIGRADFKAFVFDGKIFVVGGWQPGKELQTSECYDPDVDTWTLIKSKNVLNHVEMSMKLIKHK
jgi:hypothetical protein